MVNNEAASVLEGELIDGQFRIHHQIGEGGMGTVWAAEDLQLGRMVAAKFLWQHMAADPRVRERFIREARMTARVRSAHVVQVFAQGCTPDDVPYLIMELLDGEDLSTHLQQRKRCGLRESADVVEQVCRGLSCAHAQGLVHRDIKPQNIFLARADGRAHVKLLDFGIAKDLASLRDSLTACGEVVGSALYSSPEQLRDPQAVDRATDIWALGVVIFEMLTGHLPFAASSMAELIELHNAARFPSASSFVPELPRALDGFFEVALHVDPRKRWPSVEQLAEAFTAIARSVPDVQPSDAGMAFGAAQTLRSSPSTPAARPLQRNAGRARWALGMLLMALLGFWLMRVWLGEPASGPPKKELVRPATSPPVVEAPPRPSEALAPTEIGASAPEALSPPEPAALPSAPPRTAAASSKRSRAAEHSLPPAAAPAAKPSSPEAPRSELPGRNHGF